MRLPYCTSRYKLRRVLCAFEVPWKRKTLGRSSCDLSPIAACMNSKSSDGSCPFLMSRCYNIGSDFCVVVDHSLWWASVKNTPHSRIWATVYCLTWICTSPNAAPVLDGEQRRYITRTGWGKNETRMRQGWGKGEVRVRQGWAAAEEPIWALRGINHKYC